jgi:hypothetical protein
MSLTPFRLIYENDIPRIARSRAHSQWCREGGGDHFLHANKLRTVGYMSFPGAGKKDYLRQSGIRSRYDELR